MLARDSDYIFAESTAMDRFSTHLEAAVPQLRQRIIAEFSERQSQFGFRSAWEHYEDVIISVLLDFLTHPPLSIPERDIKKAKSKSVYRNRATVLQP